MQACLGLQADPTRSVVLVLSRLVHDAQPGFDNSIVTKKNRTLAIGGGFVQ
jgi:hypothetical protein